MTNIVIETGRLTADPELRYTGETPLCKFRIAVDRPKKKGADKPETDFFNSVEIKVNEIHFPGTRRKTDDENNSENTDNNGGFYDSTDSGVLF